MARQVNVPARSRAEVADHLLRALLLRCRQSLEQTVHGAAVRAFGREQLQAGREALEGAGDAGLLADRPLEDGRARVQLVAGSGGWDGHDSAAVADPRQPLSEAVVRLRCIDLGRAMRPAEGPRATGVGMTADHSALLEQANCNADIHIIWGERGEILPLDDAPAADGRAAQIAVN